jgi:hypothetical protein
MDSNSLELIPAFDKSPEIQEEGLNAPFGSVFCLGMASGQYAICNALFIHQTNVRWQHCRWNRSRELTHGSTVSN